MSDHILFEGEQCKSPTLPLAHLANREGTQNQLSSLVLQCLCAPTGGELQSIACPVHIMLTSAQHLRLARRRDSSGGQIFVSLVESF
jgi:hypothetical protein